MSPFGLGACPDEVYCPLQGVQTRRNIYFAQYPHGVKVSHEITPNCVALTGRPVLPAVYLLTFQPEAIEGVRRGEFPGKFEPPVTSQNLY